MEEPRITELPAGALAELACELEVSAPKPGNVHPSRSFHDSNWLDFLRAARASAPVFDRAVDAGVGTTVLDAVRASRESAAANVNLGIILLIAPLAALRPGEKARQGVRRVLRSLVPEDCVRVYEAIRLASPGGLGTVDECDVNQPPPSDLVHAMSLAQERDLVARQYARDFEDVFDTALPVLRGALERGLALERAIVILQLELMRRFPDSLIARKCGLETARESSRRAARVLDAGWPGRDSQTELEAFDRWLRAEGNLRNPGTTADLIAATLFLALRTGIISAFS